VSLPKSKESIIKNVGLVQVFRTDRFLRKIKWTVLQLVPSNQLTQTKVLTFWLLMQPNSAQCLMLQILQKQKIKG